MMAEGTHPFPYRTRPLSPPAPMVLVPKGTGRVGRCQAEIFCLQKFLFLENWITQVLLRINIEVQFVLIMMDEKRMEKEEKRSAFSDVVKLQRAHGGCLGARSRRRTQRTAISLGER